MQKKRCTRGLHSPASHFTEIPYVAIVGCKMYFSSGLLFVHSASAWRQDLGVEERFSGGAADCRKSTKSAQSGMMMVY